MKKVAYVVIIFPAFLVLWDVIIGMWAVELALGAAALVGIFALPIAILMIGTFKEITILSIVTGVLALGVGLVISKNLGEK